MSEISAAIKATQTRIAQLQSDLESLQRAASIMGGGEAAPAKATRQKAKPPAKATPKPQPKKPRAGWSAARRQRMKAYWAKRKKPSATTAAAPAEPKAAQKRKRKPWSAAAKRAMSMRIKASWAKRRKAKG